MIFSRTSSFLRASSLRFSAFFRLLEARVTANSSASFWALVIKALAGQLGAVFENCPGLGGFLASGRDLGLGVEDFVFDRLLDWTNVPSSYSRFEATAASEGGFGLNHGRLGIGQGDFLLLQFLFEAGCIELDEEVARFDHGPFLDDLDDGECPIAGPGQTADFDVLAALDFTPGRAPARRSRPSLPPKAAG